MTDRNIELETAISIARDCLANMIERATETASIVELVAFGQDQLGGDFDELFATLVRERSEAARTERLPRTFVVSAAHPVSHWAAIRETVTCYVYPDLEGRAVQWYASSAKYGCGKNAKTPEKAIDQLLRDHGCQGVVSTRVDEAARRA